ncbi:TolC family outer membrane protein [Nioella aestuarii]|uniref:TolC family outer membrane protein n=1 Tax=Nioella aestuarii TaxID=1662864 RepID=UPI003D7FD775
MRVTILRHLAATAIAVGAALFPHAADADGLSDALADAYRNSDLLEQNRYLLRLQDESVAQQVAGLRPVLSFVASSQWDVPADIQTDRLSLVASMLVYDGGGRRLARDAAQETVLATRQALVNLEQRVLLDAVTAYMQVWRDMQVVQVRESNVRVITQQLRASEDRFEVGEATRTDVAQAEAQLAQARGALVAAQGALMIDRELFEIAVGRSPNGLTGPGGFPSLPSSEDEAASIARVSHPSILALQHEVRADELTLAAARTDYGPEVSVTASTGFDPAPSANGPGSTRLSIELTQPLYAGGRLASAERIALATLHATQAELNYATRTVLQGIGNAYAQIRIASASIQASQQQIRASQLAFRGVQEEASLGARTTLDVLDAEQDLLEARIGLIEAQTSLYTASYGLLAAMGLLTVEHLGLDVPEYDPTEYYNAVSGAPMRPISRQGQQLDAVLDRLGRD